MVKAIARQTFRNAADRAAVEAFDNRLMALSEAHDLLLRGRSPEASMGSVVASTLALHGDERFVVDGVAMTLGSRTSLYLALLLNELSTNAAKYGALSAPEGQVDIGWGVEGDDLVLTWLERHGPRIGPPDRKGFGSRLIGMGLGNSQADLRYEEAGLSASFRISLDQASL